MATKKNVPAEKKPKRKSNGKNSPVIGNNGLMTEPGDTAKYLSVTLQIANLPDIDITDPEQVSDRINEYFNIQIAADLKPTVTGLAMALGLNRQELWMIKTGNFGNTRGKLTRLPQGVTNSIKKAYDTMGILWENYMQNGKINPVSGIFLGKNNFGYRDQTEYVVTPNTQKDEIDAESIRKRYLTESDDDNVVDIEK